MTNTDEHKKIEYKTQEEILIRGNDKSYRRYKR